jgi:hypothetical protein
LTSTGRTATAGRVHPTAGYLDQPERRTTVVRAPKPSTRRPATKFAHLQKKLQKAKVRKASGKKK